MFNVISKEMAALHSAVLLFALSGLFAKWLTLPAFYIVTGRAFFAAIAIFLFLAVKRQFTYRFNTQVFISFAVSGALLALHWTSFFYAIQISTITIGLITFACFPLIVSILEPWWFKERYHWHTFVQACFVLLGIVLIVPAPDSQPGAQLGIISGLVSALTFAVLTLVNRQLVKQHSSLVVAGWQNCFAVLCLLPAIVYLPEQTSMHDLTLLLILGVVFTACSHSLFNFSLKTITAHMASIAVSLEPVYGIIAAILLLDERLTFMMMVGGTLVILTNLWASRPKQPMN